MSQPPNTTPSLRLMSYSQWLAANPDMKKKKPEKVPCLACCDKWGNRAESKRRPDVCGVCGNRRTVIISAYDIYKAQIEKDRANMIKAGIAFVDIVV